MGKKHSRATSGGAAVAAVRPREQPAVKQARTGVRDTVLLFSAMLCATLVAYWPALRGGLLWDDSGHITRPDLQSLHGLWRIWFDLGATQQYYPLLHSAFWIEHRIWGDAVLGYHLTNVFLHAAAACLVVLIARRLALPGAWLAGFVFALHPVCVEAVAWIAEQKSTLSAVFCLAAALTYLYFDRTRQRSHYLLASGLFLLALLSKTVIATLPAALLVILWWQRGRLDRKRDVLPLLPWFAVGIAAGLLTAWVERRMIGAEGADFALTFGQRFLLAGRVLWFYAAKLLWPADLIFTYPRWVIDARAWWQYLFPLGAIAAASGVFALASRPGAQPLVHTRGSGAGSDLQRQPSKPHPEPRPSGSGRSARSRRGPAAAFLLFAGTLFPVLGFFNVYPFRFSYVADHFQYLASLAILVPLAAVIAASARRVRWGSALPIALLALLGTLTWLQAGTYRDAETLYTATLARNPASWMARNNLGFLLSLKPGRLPDAISQYEAALRIKPDYAGAHLNLANALSQLPGRLPDAIQEYRAALRLRPDYPEAHNGLGNALLEIPGRLPDAMAEFQAALRGRPDFAEAHNNLGFVLAKFPGRLADAIAEYRATLRLRPDDAAAHYNLGLALARLGRTNEAIAEFRAALQLRPDLTTAREWIARLRGNSPP